MTPQRFDVTQPVTPLYARAPKKDHMHTDKAGHAHRWVDGKCDTVQSRTKHYFCPDWESCGCDGWDEEELFCPLCGEVLHVPSVNTTYYVPGRVEYTINGIPVGKEEFEAAMAALGVPVGKITLGGTAVCNG